MSLSQCDNGPTAGLRSILFSPELRKPSFGERYKEKLSGDYGAVENQSCYSAELVKSLTPKIQEVSTGTTIMAVEFPGGVVLGADSRTSAGQFVVNRASRKVSQLHNRIFVARSGSAADTQMLTSIVQRILSGLSLELGQDPRVKSAASVMQLFCYEYKDMLLAGLIVAGYDSHNGGQVYQIPLGGTRLRTPYAIGGSGSGYISAYVESGYRENMTKEECVEFVKKSIAYAVSLDGSSGGLIRITVVTKESVEEEVHIAKDVSLP